MKKFTTSKVPDITFFSVDLEGSMYYKDKDKVKHYIPQGEMLDKLLLTDIEFKEGEYDGQKTSRYLFCYDILGSIDKIRLSLTRNAHISMLFINKLLSADLCKPMGVSTYGTESDGKRSRVIMIYQDTKKVPKYYAQDEYPVSDNTSKTTDRQDFFEDEAKKIIERLKECDQVVNNIVQEDEAEEDTTGLVLETAAEQSAEEELETSGAVPASKLNAGDDLPF